MVSLREINRYLNRVKLLVHNIDDLNHFKNIGVDVDRVYLIPHGVEDYGAEVIESGRVETIASYGFLLPIRVYWS